MALGWRDDLTSPTPQQPLRPREGPPARDFAPLRRLRDGGAYLKG